MSEIKTEALERGHRKTRLGTVVSDAQEKTIVVRVDRRSAHPLYKKVLKNSKKYSVHDEDNKAKNGDRVVIVETRPLSKSKRWRLVEVTKRSE